MKRLTVQITELMIQMTRKLPPQKAPSEKNFNVSEAMERAIMGLGFNDFNKLISLKLFDPGTMFWMNQVWL